MKLETEEKLVEMVGGAIWAFVFLVHEKRMEFGPMNQAGVLEHHVTGPTFDDCFRKACVALGLRPLS